MDRYKTSLLFHTRAVQQCLPRFGAEAKIDLASMMLDVRARNRYYLFYPQYICNDNGQKSYSRQLIDKAKSFMGWLPYTEKRWPAGAGKFAFKDFCVRNELRTPRMWRAPAADLRDFVVKHELGSFGKGLHGPFRTYDPFDAAQALHPQSGYYEAFVRGKVLKAFFWEDRLACVEVEDMPTAAGDGQSKLRELIRRKVKGRVSDEEWITLGRVAAFQGLTLDTIVPKGETVLIDYRYGSYAYKVKYNNENGLSSVRDTPLGTQLAEVGAILWRGIPEAIRPATLFTVDGVVDDEQQIWLLEMNCNPICHPDIYPLMFETLFGPPKPLAAPGSRVPAPGPLHAPAVPAPLAGPPGVRASTAY